LILHVSKRHFSRNYVKAIIRISPAIISATKSSVRIIVNFPMECCKCFDVTYIRHYDKISVNNNCRDESHDSIQLNTRESCVYVIYDCKQNCCPTRQEVHFAPPKFKNKKRWEVTKEESMSSESEEESSTCEITCEKKKCRGKKKCGCK